MGVDRLGGLLVSKCFTAFYDELDRLTKKTYTGMTTPEEIRCYDGKVYDATNKVCSDSGATGEAGYLTWVGNSSSWTQYRHQELGLVKWSQQSTGVTNCDCVFCPTGCLWDMACCWRSDD